MPEATSSNRYYLQNWLPIFLWAALIFLFSSESFSSDNTARALGPWLYWAFPGWSTETIELVNYLLRKLGHLSEYFVFALLILRALRAHTNGPLSKRQITLGIGITALYAISDELHQVFVPSRSATLNDVLIDVCGGLAGALCFRFWNSRKRGISRVRE